jgi:hypothetical protein
MKTLELTLLPLALAAAMSLGAQAHPDHLHQAPEVKDEMVLSGHVKQVLTGENMVWIHNDHGAEVDVAMRTLGPLSDGRIGLDVLEPARTSTLACIRVFSKSNPPQRVESGSR